MLDESKSKARLKSRTTVSISDGGMMRMPRDMWRSLGEPDGELEVDLVEHEDGSMEVRLR